jgi:hypothetical protein
MNAKLFLVYLRIRKLLPAIAFLGLVITIYNQFPNYRNALADNSPWIVEEIIYGDRFRASRSEKQFEIYLCGIAAGDKSKEYLRSLLNKGNLVIDIVKDNDGITVAEVFVQTLPDKDEEIHVNSEMITGGMAVLENPDICPSAEYLKLAASQVEKN